MRSVEMWYEVLEVDVDADDDTIRQAYRRLARTHHPDMGGSADAFRRLTDAYATARGATHPTVEQTQPSSATQDTTPRARRFTAGDGWVLHGQRGDDVRTTVTVDQRTAVFGGSVVVRRNRFEPCPTCRGAGDTGAGCTRCDGAGRVVRFVAVDVDVAPRTVRGTEQRLAGLGHAGAGGVDDSGRTVGGCGPCGALLVTFDVVADTAVLLRGDDLVTSVEISCLDAMTGIGVRVPSLDGTWDLTVGAGVQPGQRLRMRGLGAPKHGDRGRGDLVVEVVVTVPDDLDEQERAVIDAMRRRRARGSRP